MRGMHTHISKDRYKKLQEECWRLTRNDADFRRSDSLAKILLEYGKKENNREAEANGLYFLGVYDGNPATAELRHKKLEQCMRMLEPGRDDTLLLKVYNALGIYEVVYYRRYSRGVNYFRQTINIAKSLNDKHKVIVAEQNLSGIMVFTGDTLGISYDTEIFDYARETGDSTLMYSSASHCGIYYSRYNFDEQKARYFADLVKGTAFNVNYNKIMSYIALHHKDYGESERQMRAVLAKDSLEPTANFNFAELLNVTNRWEASNRYLDRADSLYEKAGAFGPNAESARLRASNYEAMGDYPNAYKWQRIFSERQDSLQKSSSRRQSQTPA